MSFTPAPYIRPRPNIGGGLDIPYGRFYKGAYGDSILSGGYTNFLGVGGRGNTFKTLLTITICIIELLRQDETTLVIYDTEVNFEWERLKDICASVGADFDKLIDSGRIVLTSAAEHMGNEWWSLVTAESLERAKDKSLKRVTPFLNRDGKPIAVVLKRTHFMDSLSEFTTDAIQDIYKKNEIDDAAATTDAMRDGGIKTRMIKQIPAYTAMANMSVFCTAHVGDEIKISQYDAFKQQLMAMKKGLKFKGCPEKFTFMTSLCWVIGQASPVLHDSDKTPKFPSSGFKDKTGDTDLQELDFMVARSKHGPSGHNYSLLISQSQGFLPELSNYYNIMARKDKFGLTGPEGIHKNYRLDLYPDVLLKRTEIRDLTKADAKLACALELTYNLCQMYDYWVNFPREDVVQPKDIYAKLIEMGYDWDSLLQTRNWWTYDDYKHPVGRLTSLDLINMYFGRYVPYWWDKKNKPIDLTKAAVSALKNTDEVVYGYEEESAAA
jgi:hypothetical protein